LQIKAFRYYLRKEKVWHIHCSFPWKLMTINSGCPLVGERTGKKEEDMRTMFRKTEAGLTLIEMLIVVLLVGILAAVAAPLYLGYTKDAKLSEGKALAGSVWTALQAVAQQSCGVAQNVSSVYSKAGLVNGNTVPARWAVSPGGATLNLDCATLAYTLTGGPVFINGTATDTNTLQINLDWNSTATPPAVLSCNSGGGWAPC
jgi:type IV pilus assembly protein PilA